MKKGELASKRKILRELLREIRKEAGFGQVELAARLGKPQSFVSKYEAGERQLDLIEVREICLAIGISIANLLKRLEKMFCDSYLPDRNP